MTKNRSITVLSPQLSPVLDQPANVLDIIKDDESLQHCQISQLDLANWRQKSLTIRGCKFIKPNFYKSDLRRLDIGNSQIVAGDFSALRTIDSAWDKLTIEDSRLSGWVCPQSTLANVHFKNCKIDYANFRMSKFNSVIFEDCVLDEADFGEAQLTKVKFSHCQLHGVSFNQVVLKSVDLRTNQLTAISGLNYLGGATIDNQQLISISPILAAQLKIDVIDY